MSTKNSICHLFFYFAGKYFLIECNIQICKSDKYRQYDTKLHNKLRKICVKLIKTIEKCKKVVYYETIKERGDRKRNY